MKLVKQIQIIVILNVGLLFLAWGIGFSMGIKKTDVTVTLDSDQVLANQKPEELKFRADTSSLHKVCATLYLDKLYSPICFCNVKWVADGKKNQKSE